MLAHRPRRRPSIKIALVYRYMFDDNARQCHLSYPVLSCLLIMWTNPR